MRTVGLAKARPAAGVILGLVLAQGLVLASGLPRFASSTPATPIAGEGGVLVSTDKLRYAVGETIIVRVSNTLDTVVTTRDQRFECTIIALERRSESGREWTEVRRCYSGAPVSEVTLEPGASITIRLEPGGITPGPLEPGVYRAALDYVLGDRFSLAPADLRVARSGQFRVE
jgi:hypothetical protein